jgi:hypothetical protein
VIPLARSISIALAHAPLHFRRIGLTILWLFRGLLIFPLLHLLVVVRVTRVLPRVLLFLREFLPLLVQVLLPECNPLHVRIPFQRRVGKCFEFVRDGLSIKMLSSLAAGLLMRISCELLIDEVERIAGVVRRQRCVVLHGGSAR